MKEVDFDVDIDGVKVKYRVRKPSNEEYREAKKVYNKAFNDAIQSKAQLRTNVANILKEQGLWDDDKQNELEEIQREIRQSEFLLHKGNITKSHARKVALDLKKLRDKFREVFIPINDFNKHTAEGQADSAEFDYLASVCIVKADGSPYFSDYNDYLNKDTDQVAIVGARKFAKVYYNLDEDYDGSLIENQVLKQLNFVNDSYQLIDKQGRLIDEDGRLIDDKGRYINEQGNFIDIYGHPLDENGNFAGERGVFIDDEVDNKKEDTATVTT